MNYISVRSSKPISGTLQGETREFCIAVDMGYSSGKKLTAVFKFGANDRVQTVYQVRVFHLDVNIYIHDYDWLHLPDAVKDYDSQLTPVG